MDGQVRQLKEGQVGQVRWWTGEGIGNWMGYT